MLSPSNLKDQPLKTPQNSISAGGNPPDGVKRRAATPALRFPSPLSPIYPQANITGSRAKKPEEFDWWPP
jgi:hypothetical protein